MTAVPALKRLARPALRWLAMASLALPAAPGLRERTRGAMAGAGR